MGPLNADITAFVKDAAADMGHPNVLVGFARVRDIPTSDTLPEWIETAISVAVAMDPAALVDIHSGPTKEYYDESVACGEVTDQIEKALTDHLQGLGYRASASKGGSEHMDDAHPEDLRPRRSISQRSIAAHAGLGWVGKNGLIITKHFGPAIFLATVFTDAPLDCANEVFLSRCGRCYECISACPANAIKIVEWDPGSRSEDMVDLEKCRSLMKELSTEKMGFEALVCGLCLHACPYTKSYIRRSSSDCD